MTKYPALYRVRSRLIASAVSTAAERSVGVRVGVVAPDPAQFSARESLSIIAAARSFPRRRARNLQIFALGVSGLAILAGCRTSRGDRHDRGRAHATYLRRRARARRHDACGARSTAQTPP